MVLVSLSVAVPYVESTQALACNPEVAPRARWAISSRIKALDSTFRKVFRQTKALAAVQDVLALRIILEPCSSDDNDEDNAMKSVETSELDNKNDAIKSVESSDYDDENDAIKSVETSQLDDEDDAVTFVDTEDAAVVFAAYRALGSLRRHGWHEAMHRFKDYVRAPKPNG